MIIDYNCMIWTESDIFSYLHYSTYMNRALVIFHLKLLILIYKLLFIDIFRNKGWHGFQIKIVTTKHMMTGYCKFITSLLVVNDF